MKVPELDERIAEHACVLIANDDRAAEAIERAYDPSRRRIAADRLLREAVHEYGGPAVHNGSQDQQRSFDSTCRKLHRFLTPPRP